jgi:hypothetical protein
VQKYVSKTSDGKVQYFDIKSVNNWYRNYPNAQVQGDKLVLDAKPTSGNNPVTTAATNMPDVTVRATRSNTPVTTEATDLPDVSVRATRTKANTAAPAATTSDAPTKTTTDGKGNTTYHYADGSRKTQFSNGRVGYIDPKGNTYVGTEGHMQEVNAASDPASTPKPGTSVRTSPAPRGSKYTAPANGINEYQGGNTPQGSTTPTGYSNKYGDVPPNRQRWDRIIPGFEKMDNATAQAAMYDYLMKSPEGRREIRDMWSTYGLTNRGKGNQALNALTTNGKFNDGVLDDEKNLAALKDAYTDGMFGVRQLRPREYATNEPLTVQRNPLDLSLRGVPPALGVDTPDTTTVEARKPIDNGFHEPLRWYDLASPLGALMGSFGRIPELYNPTEYHQLRYKLQDPTAALQANQADFNAGVQAVQSSGAGEGNKMANIAQLAASKYNANNQILGQYENQNAQIKNNEITYNTQVRDKQGLADQQARESYDTKVKQALALQQEQKLTAVDALAKTYAENRALNRNGNLMMKFAPAFNQYGNYNGYETKFSINPMLGVNAGTDALNGKKQDKYSVGQPYVFGNKAYKWDGTKMVQMK